MKIARTLAMTVLIGAGWSAPSLAECVYPKTPMSAPDGKTATEAEMAAGREALLKYQTEVTAYLGCLDKEGDTLVADAGQNTKKAQHIKEMIEKKHDAAVDELQTRADEFNQQLRAFKNKNKG